MKYSDNAQKQASLEVAEAARQTEWNRSSFMADLFTGDFHWHRIHPFPLQSEEDRLIGDAFLTRLEACLREHIDPDAVDRTGELPESALKALAELGCFGMKIPKQYGGLGLSQVNYNRAVALVGSYCASTAVWLSAHQSIGVPQPLKDFGTEEQKARYLPRLAKGEISAFALTEPEVGSDPARMTLTATPVDGGHAWLLNGLKMWCTNGPRADILVVMARTPPKLVDGREKPQITAFIVERTMPGFCVEHQCHFMGLHGISNGLLRFTDVKVPTENIIGQPGMGLKIALTTLNTGRLTLPAASSAVGKFCLKHCREWAMTRVQWGCPIARHELIADKLARMAASTFATEAVTWLCSALADAGDADIRLEAAIAKYFCTEAAWQIVDDAVQIRGGRGYETAHSLGTRGEAPIPFERLMRDIRINRIIEGSSEIMKLFIAREALDSHFRHLMPMMDERRPKSQRLAAAIAAIGFYAHWYPGRWLPRLQRPAAPHLSWRTNRHLRWIGRQSRRLARAIFHALAANQQRLEKRQLLLSRLVDIGTELFAMASALAYADALVARDGSDRSPEELADGFCRLARRRVDAHFHALHHHDDRTIGRLASHLRHERYRWLENGIVGDLPPIAAGAGHQAVMPATEEGSPARPVTRRRRQSSTE